MDPSSTVRELLSGLTVGNPFSREGSQGSSGSEPVASVLVSSSLREGGRICLGLSFDPNLSRPLLEAGGRAVSPRLSQISLTWAFWLESAQP